MKVESIMSREIHVCRGNETALTALGMMRDHDCGCIPVIDQCTLVGIVTDRDLVMAAAAKNVAPSRLRLADIMTDDVILVYPNTPVLKAEATMRAHQLRRIPVADGAHRPLGIVSLGDIARAGVAEHRRAEDELVAQRIATTLAALSEPSAQRLRATG